jgi:hypothetical protein
MAIALHKSVHRDLPFRDIVSTIYNIRSGLWSCKARFVDLVSF